jgi:hypothetical protein
MFDLQQLSEQLPAANFCQRVSSESLPEIALGMYGKIQDAAEASVAS